MPLSGIYVKMIKWDCPFGFFGQQGCSVSNKFVRENSIFGKLEKQSFARTNHDSLNDDGKKCVGKFR